MITVKQAGNTLLSVSESGLDRGIFFMAPRLPCLHQLVAVIKSHVETEVIRETLLQYVLYIPHMDCSD
jgi:hypothetical protein